MTKLHFPKNHSFDVVKYRLIITDHGEVIVDNFIPVNQPEVAIPIMSIEGIVITLEHYDSNGIVIGHLERDLDEGLSFLPGNLNLTELPVEPEIQDIAESIRKTYLEDQDAGEQVSEME